MLEQMEIELMLDSCVFVAYDEIKKYISDIFEEQF